MATALAVGALVVGAAGVGISYYGQRQAAETQARIEAQNRQIAARNAVLQQSAIRQQQQLAIAQATAGQQALNQEVALSRAQLAFANYQAEAYQHSNRANIKILTQQADLVAAQSRDDIRRQREDHLRFISSQRAAVGGSGVAVNAGTPVEVLAETAANFQDVLNQTHYVSNLQRTGYLDQADVLRYEGKLRAAGDTFASAFDNARLDLNYALQSNQYKIDEFTAGVSARNQLTRVKYGLDAELRRPSQAGVLRTAATGTLLTGVGQIAGSTYATGSELGYFSTGGALATRT